MANSKSAAKRARQSEKKRRHNSALRSRLRTCIKRVIQAVAEEDREKAQKAYREAVSVIEGSVSKGLIHKNKAARHQHRLNARVRSMS